MQHQTLYRKYRPQNLDELRGQTQVVDLLRATLASGKINHAYLFSGGRGTGKTSTARILARELGTSPEDIYEIDAASNRGIDDVRALREAVYTLPLSSKYKVYIIDEAHMLTTPAANALLKTLEEPPKHVIFILATTDKHKLPQTILSRLQTVDFKKADLETLTELVEVFALKEGITLENGVAELIAQKGDGSYRDTFSLLEKYSTQAGADKLTRALIEGSSETSTKKQAVSLIELLTKKDIIGALEQLRKDQEYSSLDLFEEVVQVLRTCLLLRVDQSQSMQSSLLNKYTSDELKMIHNLSLQTTYPITSKTLVSCLITNSLIKKDEQHQQIYIEAFLIELFENKTL